MQSADELRPTFFELFEVNSLRGMLSPAIRFILVTYATRYPRMLLPLVNRYDEVFALLMTLIERHHLKQGNGSFAESFYQLRRNPVIEQVAPVDPNSALATRKSRVDAKFLPLTSSEINKSLIGLILIPYLQSKMEEWWERNGGAARAVGLDFDEEEVDSEILERGARKEKLLNQELLNSSPDDVAKRGQIRLRLVLLAVKMRWEIAKPGIRQTLLKLYPWFTALLKLVTLAYQVLYLYGKSRYYDPWTHLAGLQVRRMAFRDFKEIQTKEMGQPSLFRMIPAALNGESISLEQWALGTRHLLAQSLQYGLPLGVFFLRFLEWWYASDYASARGDKPIPPPPETPIIVNAMALDDAKQVQMELWEKQKDQDAPQVCPSCLKTLTNPTVLPSGFVFCYPCAFKATEQGQCPITKIPVGLTDLRKMYDVAG